MGFNSGFKGLKALVDNSIESTNSMQQLITGFLLVV